MKLCMQKKKRILKILGENDKKHKFEKKMGVVLVFTISLSEGSQRPPDHLASAF